MRPNRELGQNFLIDDNLLDVIGRAAETVATTTWCSRWVAAWACSRSTSRPVPATCTWWRWTAGLEAPLRDALDPFDNATLHIGTTP